MDPGVYIFKKTPPPLGRGEIEKMAMGKKKEEKRKKRKGKKGENKKMRKGGKKEERGKNLPQKVSVQVK